MFRVGMLGTENSHALAFAKEICFKEEYKDFKITAFMRWKSTVGEYNRKCGITDAVIVDNFGNDGPGGLCHSDQQAR